MCGALKFYPLALYDAIFLVLFGLPLSSKHVERVEGEGFHFVLSWIEVYRGHPVQSLLQSAGDVFASAQSTREDDGVHFSAQHGAFRGDVLGRVPYHGVGVELGLLVTLVDSPQSYPIFQQCVGAVGPP